MTAVSNKYHGYSIILYIIWPTHSTVLCSCNRGFMLRLYCIISENKNTETVVVTSVSLFFCEKHLKNRHSNIIQLP